jgi:hypothetical protein
LSTREDEVTLSAKFEDLKNIKPEMIGIDRLFTLNESSKLLDIFSQ